MAKDDPGILALIAHNSNIADKISAIIWNQFQGKKPSEQPFHLVTSVYFAPQKVKHNRKPR